MIREVCIIETPNSAGIQVIVERKKMKTCRLKVFPSREVKFSVPMETSAEWIRSYLQSKRDWIAKKLEAFARTSGYEATEEIRHGSSIRMLGQDMTFSIRQAEKPQVHTEYRSIYIGLPDRDAPQKIMGLFEAWWKKQARNVFGEILDSLYPIIGKHGIKKPDLFIRKMRTLWGSASPHKKAITINFYLLKARRPCIEYVILHELIHFLYPNHSRSFYDFLTLCMPDWKVRKKILDNEVVWGL